MARILSCVSSAKRGVECREERQIIAGQLDAELAANKIPIKKSDPSSMRTIVSRRFVSRVPKHHQAGRRKTRRRPRPREREEKRERERAIRREKKKPGKGARPTDLLYLFFYAGINGDIFKALFRNNHKKEPFKNISVERKKDVHQPLKTTTEEEEEEEENDRENDARDGYEWKTGF